MECLLILCFESIIEGKPIVNCNSNYEQCTQNVTDAYQIKKQVIEE